MIKRWDARGNRNRVGLILFLVVVLALIMTGCASGLSSESIDEAAIKEADFYGRNSASDEWAPATDQDIVYQSGHTVQMQERLIIRNADLSVVVEDTMEAFAFIEESVAQMDGWVVSSNVWEYDGVKRGSIQVRIPAAQLDTFLDQLESRVKQVTNRTTSGQDVTEEYVDVKARLGNLEATRDRVRNFLDETKNVEEALAVNLELSRLEGEIESLAGRMQYLENSARFSAVSIDITPDELAQPLQVGGWQPQGTARDAIQALITAVQWLVDLAIFVMLLMVPLLLIIGLPFFFLIRFWRKRRAKRRSETT